MVKSLEERREIVNNILFGQPMMLMTKPIKNVKNKIICGAVTGYEIELSNLSYRGIWISTLESVRLMVDGREIHAESLIFKLGDATYPVYTLENHTEIFWGLETDASIVVNQIGGLAKGKHQISIEITKRPDFGHSFGEGTEGYSQAPEFNNPETIRDSIEVEV